MHLLLHGMITHSLILQINFLDSLLLSEHIHTQFIYYTFLLCLSFQNLYIFDLSNIHIAILFATLCFFVMIPIAHFSYKYIELPFLKYRTKYIVGSK